MSTEIPKDISRFRPFFEEIDATPSDYPGRFAFWVPTQDAFHKWPNYPVAACPASGRAAGGRGVDSETSMRSGLGEAIELASCCGWGDEEFTLATTMQAGPDAMMPARLLGFSQSQILLRDDWNSSLLGSADWRPNPPGPSSTIAWITGVDAFTNTACLIPADLVLVGRRSKGDEEAVGVATTSGCAAGSCEWDAQLSAVLELIERDATGLWWYGALDRPVLHSKILEAAPELYKFIGNRPRQTRLFDITSDIGVPVVASASWDDRGQNVALGFSADFSVEDAAVHAVVEMLQTEIGMSQRATTGDPLAQVWIDQVNASTRPLDSEALGAAPSTTGFTDDEKRLAQCLTMLESAGIRLAFVDHTRGEFGVPVFRAVSPDLCSDRPRWGKQRLFENAKQRTHASGADLSGSATEPPNCMPLLL